ncbi:hypothetical protein [Pantoea agglomerans]|uniref:hypothetical protein n=1 Tax=Enterobacter agglomerans TaxID=549 RepID=UPI0006DD4489|nr:hypothetical protein [Pantoea agglomerans]KPA08516.1 hypothetical protein PAP10c_0555 [Pantoea agglomerans]
MFMKVYYFFLKFTIILLMVLSLLLVTAASLKTIGVIDKPDIFLTIHLFLKALDYGSLTDWISAACNIVMAYAAYRAFVFAKDYFSDFIKKDGYELVKKLQLELIPQYRDNLDFSSLNILDIEVPSYVNGGVGAFQDENETSYLPQTLPEDLKKLEMRMRNGRKLEREIRRTLESLEIYGWEMIPSKKKELFHAFSIGNSLFNTVHSIIIYLEEILQREAPDFIPRFDKYYFQSNHIVKPSSPPCYQDVEVLVEKIILFQKQLCDPEIDTPYVRTIRCINKYFHDGKHLKNYFRYTRD